jgi:hypothetical protein
VCDTYKNIIKFGCVFGWNIEEVFDVKECREWKL